MAQLTVIDVSAMALDVEAAPSDLLTVGNPKTAKGEGFGYLTAILHLAPWKVAGFNTCAAATAGCSAACLNTSGRPGSGKHVARIRKTKWFRADRAAFMLQLEKDVVRHVKSAAAHGLAPAVRLNGTSDLPWENLTATWSDGSRSTIFDRFPDVVFYDYTKVVARLRKPLPANYDLTFSAADGNDDDVVEAMRLGFRVAVVFRNAADPLKLARYWELPDTYADRPLVNGDAHDLRFTEPQGVVVGLKAKGLATRDTTGFTRLIAPREEAS